MVTRTAGGASPADRAGAGIGARAGAGAGIPPGAGPDVEVEVRRSTRRTRTVSAYRQGGRVVVLIPARMSRADEAVWVERMVGRVLRPGPPLPGDRELEDRARQLSRELLEGRAVARSVAWSTRQQRRWGSSTTSTATIRLSTRLAGMPSYVLDYVLVHELTHLIVPDHSPRFWDWVSRYPQAERAQGFLAGVEYGTG